MEWRTVLDRRPSAAVQGSPLGRWLETSVADGAAVHPVVFFHTGVGKIRAAAAAQYALSRWRPPLVVNLGSCGGFAGVLERGDFVLVSRTIVYDMIDQTAERTPVLDGCGTDLDLSWLREPYPSRVRVGPMLSADRDLLPADVPRLRAAHGGIAADWESAAIAWVARANATPALILRGVSDLVSAEAGEAYGDPQVFQTGAEAVMGQLLADLPLWLSRWTRRLEQGVDERRHG